MTAATSDRNHDRKDGELIAHPVKQSASVYAGTFANALDSSGYMQSGTNATSVTFLGVLAEGKDNSTGSAGDEWARVFTTGDFEFVAVSMTQAKVGTPAYMVDNQTVQSTSTNICVGIVSKYISATRCRIKIDKFALAGL